MLSFEKLVDLGSAAPHVYVMCQNISDWLTVDYLIAYKVFTASHICFHQKSTTLAYFLKVTIIHSLCPNRSNLRKSSFISRCLFCFLWLL